MQEKQVKRAKKLIHKMKCLLQQENLLPRPEDQLLEQQVACYLTQRCAQSYADEVSSDVHGLWCHQQ